MKATPRTAPESRLPGVFAGERAPLLAGLVGNALAQVGAAATGALLVCLASAELARPGVTGLAHAPGLLGLGLLVIAVMFLWLRSRESLGRARLGESYASELRMGLLRRLHCERPDAARPVLLGGIPLDCVAVLNDLRLWASRGLSWLVVTLVITPCAMAVVAYLDPLLAAVVTATVAAGTALLLAQCRSAHRSLSGPRPPVDGAALTALETETGAVTSPPCLRRLQTVSQASTVFFTLAGALTGLLQLVTGQATPGEVLACLGVVVALLWRLSALGSVYGRWHRADLAHAKIRSSLAQAYSKGEAPVGRPDHSPHSPVAESAYLYRSANTPALLVNRIT